LRKTGAIFFVFLYMLAMLRPIQPCIEYLLNQDYIAEFLCINKDEPELQCNGKCHLVKEIEKQQQEEPITTLSVSMENYPIGFVNIYQLKLFSNPLNQDRPRFSYSQLYQFDFYKNTFQPPELV